MQIQIKTVSLKEFISFIKSRPSNKKVNMYQPFVENSKFCGCVMIHYCREVFPEHKDKRLGAGVDWVNLVNVNTPLLNFNFNLTNLVLGNTRFLNTQGKTTYKHLKEEVKRLYPEEFK